jgi:perosamine synthetase
MKVRYWPVVLGDVLVTCVSVVFAAALSVDEAPLRLVVPFLAAAVILRPLSLAVAGAYGTVWRYSTRRDFAALFGGVAGGTVVLLLAAGYVLRPVWGPTFTSAAVVTEGFINLAFVLMFRFILRGAERYEGDVNWKRTGLVPGRKVLIVGGGGAGVRACMEVRENPHLGLSVAAFLDDDPSKIGRKLRGLPVHGPTIHLGDVVKTLGIDEVIVAMPGAPQQTIMNIEALCHEIPVPFRTIPSLKDLLEMPPEVARSTLKLPMSMPDITAREIEEVVSVMQSRNLSIGSRTVEFERLIADVAEARHAVAVTNGTSALHLCMIASGVGPGDEVITSPFSFVASSNCILFEKATPVFVDIDPATLNLDPAKLEAAITERTKAIVVVHVFGQPIDMDPVMAIAERHKLTVIEDACEAIGAAYKGRPVGAIGKAGTFAFYPNKQMTTGEGAALVTNDEEWAHLFQSLRNQGRDKFDGWLNHSRLGYNYRMSELSAAVGVVQLRRLDEMLHKRDDVANAYTRALSDIEEASPLQIAATTTRMSWFVYVVRLSAGIPRDRVITLMEKRGIPTRPYFSPIHLQSFYRRQFGYEPGAFPQAEAAGGSIVALPFHTNMKVEEINVVCRALKDVISEIRRETVR